MGQFEFSGLDELQRQLDKMKQAAQELERQKDIPFSDLFTTEFMQMNTPFSTFADFLSAGGFRAETDEEFDAIPDDAFDRHVATTTEFDSWEDMLVTATQEYISRKLEF